MKFVWTFIWGFALTHMLAYVANSMLGTPYEFGTASILAIGAIILICLVATLAPAPPSEQQ
ncbi:YjzD family protein [Bacillus sp. FJAT-50079]|uniref:YjzD family protein n=1 Tax=Bacillus sp. FJAT-50079 TaxID=2833577 RepID=UPI001BCA3FBF|nr:YjzD family protein [Bacillus sp. FJAT-50079]MBS4210646.1 YjzD family protein [Bacillus sp. FJAT-50079]